MSDLSKTAPATGIEAEILVEHRRIRDLASRVEHSSELRELLIRLADLRLALVAPFVGQKPADDFHDMIRSMAPRLVGRLDQLEREHQTLLAGIDALTARGQACLAGPVAELLGDARALVRRLTKHEAAEHDILVDTLYTDVGVGD